MIIVVALTIYYLNQFYEAGFLWKGISMFSCGAYLSGCAHDWMYEKIREREI